MSNKRHRAGMVNVSTGKLFVGDAKAFSPLWQVEEDWNGDFAQVRAQDGNLLAVLGDVGRDGLVGVDVVMDKEGRVLELRVDLREKKNDEGKTDEQPDSGDGGDRGQ